MTAYSIKPHDLIAAAGRNRAYFYRVNSVCLGAEKQASVITLEAINEAAPWFDDKSSTIAVPLPVIEAGFESGAFSHYRLGPWFLEEAEVVEPEAPVMQCSAVVDSAFESSRSISFYATPEIAEKVRSYGYMKPYDRVPDKYAFTVDARYDFDLVKRYIEQLGKSND